MLAHASSVLYLLHSCPPLLAKPRKLGQRTLQLDVSMNPLQNNLLIRILLIPSMKIRLISIVSFIVSFTSIL